MNGNKCQICQQQVAKIHITQIHKDQLIEIHVCPDCARSNGLSGPGIKADISLGDLVEGIQTGEEAALVEQREESKTCPICGQTFRGFRESGRLGCRHCYDAFAEELAPLLRKVQMGLTHHGKTPPPEAPAPDLALDIHKLREDLKTAVAEEDFKLAAQLRDEIRSIEKENEG
jgi:protein arginine kinase activator